MNKWGYQNLSIYKKILISTAVAIGGMLLIGCLSIGGYTNNHWIVVGILLLWLGLSLLVSIVTARSIIKTLHDLNQFVAEVRSMGVFSSRLEVTSRDEVGQIASEFNGVMDNLEHAINAINTSMESLTYGELDNQITAEMPGDLGMLKDFINMMIANLDKTITQVCGVMERIAYGEFDVRINDEMMGKFEELRLNINCSVETLEVVIKGTNVVMKMVSENTLSQRVTGMAMGDLLELKEGLNFSLDALSSTLGAII